MTLVLDSGGLSALAGDIAKLRQVLARGEWPPLVSTGVLVESLTGDHRRDVLVNRLVRKCIVRDVTDLIARHAAGLRYASRAAGVSAIDAIVAATADHAGGGTILTSDPKDMRSLAAHTYAPVRVAEV